VGGVCVCVYMVCVCMEWIVGCLGDGERRGVKRDHFVFHDWKEARGKGVGTKSMDPTSKKEQKIAQTTALS
jgi:hypothetical protein